MSAADTHYQARQRELERKESLCDELAAVLREYLNPPPYLGKSGAASRKARAIAALAKVGAR